MANNGYTSGIDPHMVLRVGEPVVEALVPVENGGPPPRKRRRGRDRWVSSGRDKLTMALMKASMTAYWKDGNTYVEIAELVNDEFHLEGDDQIGAHNIQYHIKRQLEMARKQSLLHISERQALMLARYDQLEFMCMEAYFASCQGTNTKHYEKIIKKARSKDREKQLIKDRKREQDRVDRINKKRAKEHRKTIKPRFSDPIVGDLPDILITTSEVIKEYGRSETKPAGDPRWVAMLIGIAEQRSKLWNLVNRSDIANADQELAKLPDEERRSRMAATLHAALSRRTQDVGALAPPSPLGGFIKGDEPTIAEQITIVEPDDPTEETDIPVVEWEWD